MDFSNLSPETIMDLVVTYGTLILKFVVILVIGLWLIGWVTRLVRKGLQRSQMDQTVSKFLADLVSVSLKVLLFITVLGIFGVNTTSFAAVIAAAGLAIGMALQGSLGNFAGGVLILLFKPFKVGDLIEAQGHIGHVKSISIFVTKLLTPDNKIAIIPNGPLSNGDILNYSEEGSLRVDLVCGISYDANIKQAKEVALKVMQDDPKVLKDPAPSVNVLELADSSVNLAIRPYATPADYWDVYFGIQEKVKVALDEAGVEIPFPQMVVHRTS